MTDRDAKIERAIGELLAAFPLAFSAEPGHIKPLAIGIRQQLYQRCALSHRDVGAALRRYTARAAYQRTIIEGAGRVDLDGGTSGHVTAKEAAHAAEQVAKGLAIAAGKPKDKLKPNAAATVTVSQPPATSESSTPGRRRLGLAELRQAAAARRAPRSTAPAAAKN
jgi:sRNA-binding protein